jgi:hypothetical protein
MYSSETKNLLYSIKIPLHMYKFSGLNIRELLFISYKKDFFLNIKNAEVNIFFCIFGLQKKNNGKSLETIQFTQQQLGE